MPDHRHGKHFVGKSCKKIADDLFKLSRHQLQMVVTILTGHVPVRRHMYIMGLFDGAPTCRIYRMDTETGQHITCFCEMLTRQRYSVLVSYLLNQMICISTASVRDLYLCISSTGY